MRLLLALALGTACWGCWRGDVTVEATRPSFVARVNAVAELQRRVDALAPRIEYARQRLIGLASEAERDSIRNDLAGLEREIATLSRHVRERRARGDSSTGLVIVEHDLGQAAVAIDALREDLLYAKTTAELEALAALAQQAAADTIDPYGRARGRPRLFQTDPARVKPVRTVEHRRLVLRNVRVLAP